MAGFLRNMFRWGSGKPTVCLAAFGKHPGWDDHLEIGVETGLLANVKQVLYVEGIGGNIESGVWERLQEGQRLKRLYHIFLWRQGRRLVAGRLWSSRDGKGRSQYPMICCADCSGTPLSWVVRKIFPSLQRLEELCNQTDSASVVREIIAAEGRDLRALAEVEYHNGAQSQDAPGNAVAQLASCMEPANDHRKLLAVLYQIDTEMNAYRGQNPSAIAQMAEARPVQLRVPACGNFPGEAVLLWMRFLLSQLHDEAQMLILQPVEEPWLDLIVGTPTASQLFCMMASPLAVPMTTEIPYNFPPDFVSRANRVLQTGRSGSVVTTSGG